MSESEYNRRAQARLQAEIAELDTPHARYQAILDRWFGEQRAIAAEESRLKQQCDPYNLGLYDPP